jgi:hypothetical protein
MSESATRRTLFGLAVAGASAIVGWLPRARAAEPCGTVVAISGQCFAESGGRRIALKLGDAIVTSATIDVPPPGKLKLRLNDGSIVSLASGTRMTIAAFKAGPGGAREAAQLSLAEGLLRAVVSPVERPNTFEVKTAVGVAAVRSTDWFIEAKPGSAQVGVLTGAVTLTSSATGRAVTIPARWGARLEAGRDPVPARVWAPAEFQAVISRTDVP